MTKKKKKSRKDYGRYILYEIKYYRFETKRKLQWLSKIVFFSEPTKTLATWVIR